MAHKTQRLDRNATGQHRETLQEIARQIAKARPLNAAEERESTAAQGIVPEIVGGLPSTSDEELVANRLFEALPAGLALYSESELLRANDAFAMAFGYQNVDELRAVGGLAAIFPDHLAYFETTSQSPVEGPPVYATYDALTRSRRRITIPVAIHPIVMQEDKLVRLLVLHPEHPPEPAPIPTPPQEAEQQEEPRLDGNGSETSEPLPEPGLIPTPPREAERQEEPRLDGNGGEASGALPDTAEESPAEESPEALGGAAQTAPPEAWETDFLAKISHGVRTPLNSIIGFAELMQEERLGPIGNDRYKSYIGDIHDSGRYALSVINDLLDLSRIQAGQFELNFTSVDVNELIAGCIHTMQTEAHENRVFLRMSLTEPLPPLLADRESIRQMLFNLLTNAIKFTNPGGQVVVSTQEQSEGQVRIRVHDNGVGLSQGDIAQAMHPYRQPDTAPRKLVGTGLALPLTRALAQANRAEFKLESTPVSGTCIDITFPAERTLKR